MFKKIIESDRFWSVTRWTVLFAVALMLLYLFWRHAKTSHFIALGAAIFVIGCFWPWAKHLWEDNRHPCPKNCGQKGEFIEQVAVDQPEVGKQRYHARYACPHCGPFHVERTAQINPQVN